MAAFAIRGTPTIFLLRIARFATAPSPDSPSRFAPVSVTLHRVFVRRFQRRDSRARGMVALSRWRIELGFALGAVALATASPTRASFVAGMPFVLFGTGLRSWARGPLTRRG